MVALRKKVVFLVHNYVTQNNKHHVSFGRDLNNPKNTRNFNKISDAKKFAINKAKKIGVKKVLFDLPSGVKTIIVKKR